MKTIRKFANREEYENYLQSDEVVVPHVCLLAEENIVKIPPEELTPFEYEQLVNSLVNNILNTEI